MTDKNEAFKYKLIECAKTIIDTQGFKPLTVSNIVKKCGISKSTFYKLFSSKEDLIRSLNDLNKDGYVYPVNIKHNIILKAMELFISIGYTNVDMDLIANEAGINRVSIYKYFKNKEDILEKCILYEIEKRKEYANKVRETVSHPVDVLIKYAEYNCDYTNSPNAFLLLLSREVAYKNKRIQKIYNEFIQYRIMVNAETIEQGKRMQIFKNDINSVALAKIFVTFFNNLDLRPAIDISTIKRTILEMIFGLLNKE